MIDDLVTRSVTGPYGVHLARRNPAEAARRQRRPAADAGGTRAGLRRAGPPPRLDGKATALADGLDLLNQLSLTPTEAGGHGLAVNRDGAQARAPSSFWRLPDVDLPRLSAIWPELGAIAPRIAGELEIDAKYACYVRRQHEEWRRSGATRRPKSR